MSKKEKLHYAAGVFDVRGSILIGNCYSRNIVYKYPKVRLSVPKSKVEVLCFLKDCFGGCVTNTVPLGVIQQWTTSNKKAIVFMKEILPYMKNKKRIKQIEFILNNWKTCENNSFDGLTTKEKKSREKFYKNWSLLNV